MGIREDRAVDTRKEKGSVPSGHLGERDTAGTFGSTPVPYLAISIVFAVSKTGTFETKPSSVATRDKWGVLEPVVLTPELPFAAVRRATFGATLIVGASELRTGGHFVAIRISGARACAVGIT
jgi:hypothetical protein